MSVATTTVTDRAAWLAERRKGIGASESAAALGVSPYETPLNLYLRKLGFMPDAEETEPMRWGSLLEPLIAAEYERRTGKRVVEQQVFLRSPVTPLFATLDGMTDAGHPVEFKAVGNWTGKTLGDEGTDEVPDHWLIQGHQQMLLSSTFEMDFAVLVGGQKLRLYHLIRDEELVESIIVRVREFWGRVERREPPEPDPARDAELMHLLHRRCEGEVTLGEQDAELVRLYEMATAERKDMDRECDELRARILAHLGEHATGRLPDGRTIKRKLVTVPSTTVERKGYTFTTLRIGKGPAGR